MTCNIQPLKTEKFLKAALEYMEPLKSTYIYDAIVCDYRQKTDQEDAGYGEGAIETKRGRFKYETRYSKKRKN